MTTITNILKLQRSYKVVHLRDVHHFKVVHLSDVLHFKVVQFLKKLVIKYFIHKYINRFNISFHSLLFVFKVSFCI